MAPLAVGKRVTTTTEPKEEVSTGQERKGGQDPEAQAETGDEALRGIRYSRRPRRRERV